MAALLALVSAVFFALAAALQQRGQFRLAQEGNTIRGLGGLFRLIAVPVWLLGTAILLCGYGTQAVALDQGKIVVVQPLLVTTIVWALPLGYLLSHQHLAPRQIIGAAIVVIGLALFVLVGDPDAGVDSAKTSEMLIAVAAISILVLGLLASLRHQTNPALRAAVYGVCAGLFFGLSAMFTKSVLKELDVSIAEAAGDWRTWALLGFGVIAFLIQQLSLSTGQLAPAVAAVSVANPAISVILGILLFEERLTRPGWHVLVAFAALLAALWGAVIITMANQEIEMPGGADASP